VTAAGELVSRLRSREISVWAEGDQLRLRATKGALTSELTQELARRKAEILAYLREERQGQSGADEAIVSAEKTGTLPLSFAQQRLWFLHQLEGGSTYNMPLGMVLEGQLDARALRHALADIWRRHEVLRTRFSSTEGQPALVVVPPTECILVERSLESCAAPELELQRLASAEACRPFDLERSPPLRMELLRLAPLRHALLITAHHIAFDAWSTGVFLRELSLLYAAQQSGRPSPLPALSIQYADYARWQRRRLGGAALAAQLGYWREQLRGVPAALDFPSDRPRPALSTFRGAARSFELDPLLGAELERLGRETQATLFMLLMTAFSVLLQRYSGQDDFVVGTPIAGRTRVELEPLIGCFVNTLALRMRPGRQQSVRELIRAVRRTSLDAYANQELPFEQLVEQLRPERDLGRNPLFQFMFSLDNAPAEELQLPELRVSWLTPEWTSARLDLTLSMDAQGQTLRGALEYNSDLFDAPTIDRFIEHYQNVLTAMVCQPDTAVARLPLLSRSDLAVRLLDFERGCRTEHPSATLLDAFEAQVAARPEAIALEFDGRSLSYRQLSERANQLAWYLRAQGLRAGERVAFCIERSEQLLVGLLGVLGAGGAYVPLDPGYPARRLAFMLQDCRPRLVLTEERWLSQLDCGTLRVVLVDRERAAIAEQSSAPPPRALCDSSPAYVIYTSGSTGLPKGVEVPHRALLNLLLSMRALPGLRRQDTLLAITTISFDIAGLELFLPLLVGARIVLLPPDVSRDPARLSRAIVLSGATVLQGTPAAFQMLVAAGFATGSLRLVLCGGEALSRQLADDLLGHGVELWNVYGPTETTIWSTAQRVAARGRPDPAQGTVPIGQAIDNTRVHLLDRNGELVPTGVIGELCIAGAGLANGYFRRPALTAERFTPEPGGAVPGARMYRTGDRARLRADGSLEFLGRIDQQIKLRGQRIELGEIEARLGEHPSVRAAAVVLRELEPGDARLLAYVVPAHGQISSEELRSWLRERLPEVMVPASFCELCALPLTPNGKLDRRALPSPARGGDANDAAASPTRTELEQRLAHIWSELLQRDDVDLEQNFFDLGGHSLLLVRLHARLKREIDPGLTLLDLFRFPAVRSLAEHIARAPAAATPPCTAAPALGSEQPIAIVGMAGRFPRAANLAAFWQNLRQGLECIRVFSEAELLAAGVSERQLHDPRYVPARGVLEEVELFDAAFFGFSPREAELMDPQQRILLEVAWQALENAGYAALPLPFLAGVFASASQSVYALSNLAVPPEGSGADTSYLAMIGNDKDYLATRLSYAFDLQGPSLSVQTACSSSLVAVHLACASLRRGECDLALAGGVCVQDRVGYLYEAGMVASPDGHCRAFDERAQGTVWGSGAGMVVLRRLSDAIRDGDTVHALIRGSAVNNDGARKVGYMAPSVHGQAAVIARARAAAGVDGRSIGYVEAHGTGTQLGDPIELAALREATPRAAGDAAWCALGSVKTNIGHLDAAAGIAGLLKTVLVLQHGEIPPTLHFERPNPQLELGSTPFHINDRLLPWPRQGGPRRAGVSSFGIGGTNAHVVLEEAMQQEAPREEMVQQEAVLQEQRLEPATTQSPDSERGRCQLLLLSARSESALEQLGRDLVAHLRQHPKLDLADVAFTLRVGRRTHLHRRSVIAADVDEALRALELHEPGAVAELVARPVAFLFPGQGSQYPTMGQDLYQAEPCFRAAVDRCAEILEPHLGLDLRALLYPGVDCRDPGEWERASRKLDQTRHAQPALFTVAYATAQLWMSWGIFPEAMLGHSIGEYVAATLAGVFELEDALALVAARGALVQSLPRGAMLAVPLELAQAQPLLGAELSLAAHNGPSQCVASGPVEAIERLAAALCARGIEGTRLKTSHAFHSSMLDPVLARFRERVSAVRLSPPRIPIASNVTGAWISAEQATSPDYWTRQLRETVDFAGALATLAAVPDVLFLEVGPGRTLAGLARRLPVERQPRLIVASLPGASDQRRALGDLAADTRFINSSFGRLWAAGAKLARAARAGDGRRHRIPLPSYPFERQRYWIDKPELRAGADALGGALAKRPDVSDWFYLPSFQPALRLPALRPRDLKERRRFWVFGDGSSSSRALRAFLERAGQEVVTVLVGEGFAQLGDAAFSLRPASLEDHERLLAALADSPPDRIIHLWSCSLAAEAPGRARFDACQERGFYSLIALSRALSSAAPRVSCKISVVSNHLFDPHGGSLLWAEKGPLVGLGPVIAQEYPELGYQTIDIELPEPASREEAELMAVLVAEILSDPPAPSVALRDGDRWLPALEPLRLTDAAPIVREFRPRGVYLITGGLGRIGLCLARHLAGAVQARLVLTTPSPFPARSAWGRWLEEHPAGDVTRLRIAALTSLEELGAEVLVLEADVADAPAMRQALALAEARFGPLDGLIHAAGARSQGSFITPLSHADPPACEAHFRPKVQGTYVLHELLGERELDFCLLLSSTSALLGGLGLGPYAAANRFLDAFVQAQRQAHRGTWLVIDWDAWNFDREDPLDLAMTPQQGVAAFDRAVRRGGSHHLVIATASLEPRLARWVQAQGSARSVLSAAAEQQRHVRPALSAPFVAPRTELERRVTGIFAAVLGFETVGIFDDLFELGGDSLSAIQIVARVQAEVGQHLSPALLLQSPTVVELAARLEQPETGPRSPAVPISPRGHASPLFWVPGTGGNVLYFQPLASQLEPAGHPFYALEPVGMDGLEAPRSSVPEIARSYLSALRAIQPHGPYYLGGHSFGSWVAYELSQQLLELGEPIERLVVLDTVAPAQRDLSVYRGYTGADWILTLAGIVGSFLGKPLAVSRERLLDRSWDEQLEQLCKALQAVGFMPPGAERRHIQGLVAVYRTQAQMEYRRPPGRPVPIALFRASDLNPESEEVPEALRADPTWGWQPYAAGQVSVDDVPGDHLTMMRHPHVQALAERLRLQLPLR